MLNASKKEKIARSIVDMVAKRSIPRIPVIPTIPLKILPADARSGARKNTQAALTNWKVMNHASHVGI